MVLAAGTKLGRYTVVKPLVTGGLADVLLARATGMVGFQHHVVIKHIRSHKNVDPKFVEAFLDEARLAASLHHHHIVQVHDVGREDNDYFFAMEYVHGENLRKLLTKVARARELVPLGQVVTIMLACASALHCAHQQDIVHRDVAPANIIVGYDGNVKVLDFGIAKAAMRRSAKLTKSGAMRGKVAYMAPEQCLGRPVDRRSDIFSLGIVLYELCTSRRLFKGDTDFIIMTSIVNGKIPKPSKYRADLPLELEDVILKALAPKPEQRFPTAEDLAMSIERVAVASGIRVSATALAEYMRRLFGQRPEPWLTGEEPMEHVDVDFDGGGTGLVVVGDDEQSNPTIKRELLESPFLAGSTTAGGITNVDDDDDDEFLNESKTELVDQSPFEGSERTQIGEQADLDMLVNMSKIEGRRDATPIPRRDATPIPRRDATPVPERQTANIRTPTPLPTPIASPPPPPPPAARARGDGTPLPRAATPLPLPAPASEEHPAQRSAWATPEGGVTGTPMAWQPQDGEVPSLAPKNRRVLLIAAVAVPLVALGMLVITMGKDESRAAKAVEPDAFVEPTPDVAPMATPDAAVSIDAALPATKPPVKPQPAKR